MLLLFIAIVQTVSKKDHHGNKPYRVFDVILIWILKVQHIKLNVILIIIFCNIICVKYSLTISLYKIIFLYIIIYVYVKLF